MMGSNRESDEQGAVRDIFVAQIAERRAISRYLHDAVTQDLVALSLALSGLRAEGNERLTDAIAHVDRCCRGVRALSYALAPPFFAGSGLIETMRWYAEVLRDDASIDLTIEAAGLLPDLPEEIKDLFFAGLQQITTAAIWRAPRGVSGTLHAKIQVRIAHNAGSISMRVECARTSDESITESPLIRERTIALGGTTRLVTESIETLFEMSVPWAGAK